MQTYVHTGPDVKQSFLNSAKGNNIHQGRRLRPASASSGLPASFKTKQVASCRGVLDGVVRSSNSSCLPLALLVTGHKVCGKFSGGTLARTKKLWTGWQL